MAKEEKMTLDKLAEVSQKEFVAIRSEMQDGFAAVDSRFDGLDKKFDNLTEILRLMQADLKEIKSDVQTVNLDYAELRTRVERLEKKVGLSGRAHRV